MKTDRTENRVKRHLVLFVFPDKQPCYVGRQHVLQQQAVQVLPSLDLVLLCAVFVLKQEVLTEAGLVLSDTNIVRLEQTMRETMASENR